MQEQFHNLLERIRSCAMPEGPIECRGTWVRQSGEMRLAPGRPWVPFEAQEWFSGPGVDFRWQTWFRMAPLLPARIIDEFEAGKGSLTVSIFGLLPVVRARGVSIDKSEALRGLAELPWRPFAFREEPWLTWEAAAPAKLRAIFDDGKTNVSAEFDIDSTGQILGGSATRPRLAGKSFLDTTWSGSFGEYRMYDGLRVPSVAEVVWHLPDGLFPYWRGRIVEFRILR